jgi:hypothetical protein
MSALGQKPTLSMAGPMSALGQKQTSLRCQLMSTASESGHCLRAEFTLAFTAENVGKFLVAPP